MRTSWVCYQWQARSCSWWRTFVCYCGWYGRSPIFVHFQLCSCLSKNEWKWILWSWFDHGFLFQVKLKDSMKKMFRLPSVFVVESVKADKFCIYWTLLPSWFFFKLKNVDFCETFRFRIYGDCCANSVTSLPQDYLRFHATFQTLRRSLYFRHPSFVLVLCDSVKFNFSL